MSLKPRQIPDIPEETARIAKAAFRKANPYMKMRDELGTVWLQAFKLPQAIGMLIAIPISGEKLPDFYPCYL